MQHQETWEGDATVDYLIWRDDGLVPASPADVASASDDMTGAQEDQRPRGATRRRASLRARDLRAARKLRRHRNMIHAPLMGCPPLVIPWLLAMRPQLRIADEEGAHARRPVTR
jgi:hypothetical protein